MEKFKSLLSFALGICLSSTTFKVLSNSLDTEANSKPQAAVATNVTPSVSAAIAEEAPQLKSLLSVAIPPKMIDLTPPASLVLLEEAAYTPISLAMSDATAQATTPVSTVTSEAPAQSPEEATAKKNWNTAISTYEKEANEAEKNGDIAINAYKVEIAKNPNRPDLWKKIADIENKQQHYQNAIEALKNAIKLQPLNAELYASLSETYTHTNQSKEALLAIEQALQFDPKNIDYLNRSVLLANWAEQYDLAADSYKRILRIQPHNQMARAGLENAEANLAKPKPTTELNTNPSITGPKTAVSEVMTAEAAAKTPEATVVTPVSIAMTEERAAVPTPVSIAMTEETEKAKAAEAAEAEKIEGLKNAIKLQPQNAQLYVKLSEAYALANQSKEALIAINQALKIDPKNLDYLNRRGMLAIWAEEYDQATDSYKRILKIDPNNQVARVGLNIESEIAKSKPTSTLNANTSNATISTVEEANPPVSTQTTPVSPLEVAPKRRPLATSTSVKTPKWKNILAPTTGPEDRTGSGYIEGGFESDILTGDNGVWRNQYIKGALQTDSKNNWVGEIDHDFEFGERAFYAEVENTHIINDKWFSNLGLGLSDNSTFVPKYYIGATISRKFLKEQNLVVYLGGHAYWWRPIPTSTQDLNPGISYYFESPWILEGGALLNRFHPGAIYSTSYYVSVTQGREKDHLYTLRYDFGREGYQTTGPGSPVVTNYPSTDLTATWRQWIDKNWGFNISAEAYWNPFYQRYGITVGLFRDFL